MKFLKKLARFLAYSVLIFILLLVGLCVYIWSVAEPEAPKIDDLGATQLERRHTEGSLYTIGDNWIRKSSSGLSEMYVSGPDFEMGVKNGKLSREQIVNQEIAFTSQIKAMIPSSRYLKFLRYVIGFMNKDLPDYVNKEYQREIYGESFSASDSFNWIGSPYARLLNYHAAHDIGHALQNLMLVGCTSFGAWDSKTEDGSLLIGRNFDFWVGDDFAKEKMVNFFRPEKGIPFAFVSWGGFVGVVSGMNVKGITVTINAARSDIPYGGAATPVSLVAREVLQYASSIKEAVAIAHQKKMFVSESFLIGSAKEHKAVVIEKTPDTLAVYDPNKDFIQCTNHYQSDLFKEQELNKIQKEKSASVYRYERLQELMQDNYPLNVQKIANILRDRRGLKNTNIGEGNEKAVNQLIAHHSVIFQPDSLRMWVSTQPWQLGAYICYDLGKIFALKGLDKDIEIADWPLNIAPDTILESPEYKNIERFKTNKINWLKYRTVDTAGIIKSNPYYYDAYRMAGDYCMHNKWYAQAIPYFEQALTLEIATLDEREAIEENIKKCKEALAKGKK